MKRYHLMGTCHVDVAWHGDEEQYANYLEQFTVILIDMMEQYPDMTYLIEQAYHYRKLKDRRPDLIEKLKKYIAEGRIEVVGGMISTADSNMPCSESFIRNQLLGLRWFRKEMGADVETAWLVDAFGSHAQIPQILKSFGMKQLLSSRFGGDKHHDCFLAEGLDGTCILVAGRDAFSQNLPVSERARIFFYYVNDGASVDGMFDKIYKAGLDGPLFVDVYIEDETYPTRRTMTRFHELQKFAESNGNTAFFSLARNFFAELHELNEEYPIESADLNPEFTGTYSQRVEIKLRNRRTETALLDAEKWLALLGRPYGNTFDNCWWDLGFVHFHDVFTGSHPESVFTSVLDRLDNAKKLAETSLTELFGTPHADADTHTLRITNSLPFARREWISVPANTYCTVRGSHGTVPSYYTEGRLWFAAETDACSAAVYRLEPKETVSSGSVFGYTLENELVCLTVDPVKGVTLIEKQSGRTILNNAVDLLVMQGDTGNFQIENIEFTEQHAWASPVCVERTDPYTIKAGGTFIGSRTGITEAHWVITFTLRPGEPMLGVKVHIDWLAVGRRLRIKLNTTLTKAGEGIYEVPFGVVRRRPYTPGFSRKGEWPAQRFVAIEDGEVGIALFNDGVPGVECLGGTMYSTLLRAPVQTYSFMVPDHSSQQHGEHDFHFAVLPYAGNWEDNDLLRRGQRWNTPLAVYTAEEAACDMASLLEIDQPGIILSAVKESVHDEKAFILRLTESNGREQDCTIRIPGAVSAFSANMREEKLTEIPVDDGVLHLHFKPWEICNIYIER